MPRTSHRISVNDTFPHHLFAMLKFAWILIFFAVCGINAETVQNEDEIDIANCPYVVSIRKYGRHICTGAIINEFHIITSDRCVPPFKHVWNLMSGIAIVTGTHSLNRINGLSLSREMFSENHFLNPSKNPVTSGLGIIKLLDPLKFGEHVQPIELLGTDVPANEELSMIGWNIVDGNGKKSSHLKKVALKTISREECQPFHKKTIKDFEICTVPKSKNNLCKGDKGSPLIYEGKLVGVATFGISCKDTPVPDVHGSIDKKLDYLIDFLKA